MNQWLGKFWNAERSYRNPLKMALIGDRESGGFSFLSKVCGTNAQWDPPSSTRGVSERALTRCMDVDGVRVDANLVPALSDAAGYKNERYIQEIWGAMEGAQQYHLVIICVNMSDTRLRGSVLRTLQKLKTDWRVELSLS